MAGVWISVRWLVKIEGDEEGKEE
jgi:hypothetical protein